MRIYSDSVILIYYLEGAPPFMARATARLGGVTGDVMGAMGEVAATATLLVAAAVLG